MSIQAMIQQVQVNIHYLIRTLFPRIGVLELSWGEVLNTLGNYKPKLFHLIVKWELTSVGHQKCNTDGTNKETLGPSSYNFFASEITNGDLCYAQAGQLRQMTNI